MTDDIVERLRSFDNGRAGTHYINCWYSHPACALHQAADEIERLRRQVDDLTRCLHDDQVEIARLRAERH